MSMKQLSFPKKTAVTLMGIFGVGLAMALMHFSDAGADPVTVLIGGLARALHVTEGVSTTILNAVFLVFLFFFNRRAIRAATLISVLAMGPFMDLSLAVLHRVFSQQPVYPLRLVMTVLGALLLGFSIGFYLSLDFGSSPADGVMLWLHQRLKVRYRTSTWLFYTGCLAVGWLLGGRVAIGTFLSLFVVGIVCDKTLHRLERLGEALPDDAKE